MGKTKLPGNTKKTSMAKRSRADFAYQESADESLDVYSALRKASSENSTNADQPVWGLTVWQVVGFFLLGLVVVCKYIVYCIKKTKCAQKTSRHSVITSALSLSSNFSNRNRL